MIKLVIPNAEHREKALKFRQEFFDRNEMVIYGSELFDKISDYDEWLTIITNNQNPETVNPEWVVTDTYFAFDDSNTIVGITAFRHALKGWLLDAGNIGYSVVPSERNKGYATEILGLMLKRAKEIGLQRVVVSCYQDNIVNQRVICKNGGILEKHFLFEGKLSNKYVIAL